MIRFRPFRNTDPPALVALWQSQPPTRGRFPRVTAQLLEHLVFSKIYFDAAGLLVAQQDEQLCGMAHAGFGPAPDGQSLSVQRGATAMLMVRPREDEQAIALELLHYSEKYLEHRGAEEIFGGAHGGLAPFYLGLYGGSELPGILESDERQVGWFRAAGYQVVSETSVLQRPLADFRPPMNRELLQLRRRLRVEATIDPPARAWWQACQMAQHEQTCIRLQATDGAGAAAELWCWNMEPLASSWGLHAAGLSQWELNEPSGDTAALERFLLSETLRHLQAQGVMMVETQVDSARRDRLAVLTELGFREIDRGLVFRKPPALSASTS